MKAIAVEAAVRFLASKRFPSRLARSFAVVVAVIALALPLAAQESGKRRSTLTRNLPDEGMTAITAEPSSPGTASVVEPSAPAPLQHDDGYTTLGTYELYLDTPVEWSWSGSYGTMTAYKVANRSSSRTSGTLRVSIWLSPTAPRQSGYRVQTYQFSQVLPPNYYFGPNVEMSGAITWPGKGCYYASMILEEWNSGSFYMVDYVDLDGRVSVSSGCDVTPQACSYSVSTTSVSVPASGGSRSVSVVGTPNGCSGSWSASSNNGWLSITSGGGGSGAGSWNTTFNVAANGGSARNGSLTVAGRSVSVQQAAGTTTTNCYPNSTTACVLGGRFQVSVRYRAAFDNGGANANAMVKPVSGFADSSYESAFFYFNNSNNIEMMLKMLDQGNTDSSGRPTIAVLFGTATPLRVEVTITDTRTGVVRQYESAFNQMKGVTDFTAFLK